MTYAVADYYNAGQLPPPQTTNPAGIGDPLFDYLVRRLIDSFDLPGGALTYYQYMDAAYPGTPRVDAVGRAWVMAHEGHDLALRPQLARIQRGDVELRPV
jgi:hypothetical protein